MLRNLVLLTVLIVVFYGAIYFNLVQFWITDLEAALTGQYPIR